MLILFIVKPTPEKSETVLEKNNVDQVKQGQEGQKGRFWNYEEDRWSFCDSDSDNDDNAQLMNKQADEKQQEVPKLLDSWSCPVCTLINPLSRPGCSACTTARPLTEQMVSILILVNQLYQ